MPRRDGLATRSGRVLWAALWLVACLLVACDDTPPASMVHGGDDRPGDAQPTPLLEVVMAAPEQPPFAADQPTIVSLTPAVTQMLVDMGKRNQIVGVSTDEADDFEAARCGTFMDPLIPRILELAPDVVLTQAGLDGVSPRLRELASDGVFELQVVPYSLSIADVEQALINEDHGLGQAIGDPDAASRAWYDMIVRFAMVRVALGDIDDPPRVLVLINPATLGAVGTNVTHSELIERAGAVNAAGSFETGYIELTRSQVQSVVRPDVVLILDPDGTPLAEDDPRTRGLQGLDVPAVTNDRIHVLRHPYCKLPSTALPGVLVEMAVAIHPELERRIVGGYLHAEELLGRIRDHEGGPR